jgi:hypothetical protein
VRQKLILAQIPDETSAEFDSIPIEVIGLWLKILRSNQSCEERRSFIPGF